MEHIYFVAQLCSQIATFKGKVQDINKHMRKIVCKPVDDVDIEIAMTRNDESSKLFEKSILAHLENAQI